MKTKKSKRTTEGQPRRSSPSHGSALSASEAWKGKRIKLVLLGKKHRNGKSFTETYDMTIESITDPVSLACAIREALEQAKAHTDIPADLVEGVEFRFMPNNAIAETHAKLAQDNRA